MTPEAFIKKWRSVQNKERSASQEHFIDLCRLLGEATPNEADPDGSWYWIWPKSTSRFDHGGHCTPCAIANMTGNC